MKSVWYVPIVAVMCGAMMAGVAPAREPDPAQGLSEDSAQEKLLAEGIGVLRAGNPGAAMHDYFDKIIAANEPRIAGAGKRVYAARTPAESLGYLMEASAGEGRGAVVFGSQVAYAHFMKAYALVELHRDADAKAELDAALALSPSNSQILDEIGAWYMRQHDWENALQSYQRAQALVSLAPPSAKNMELAVAWRGIGYVYVEQHRLADAEEMYQKCLELDADDHKAASELAYVRGRRAREVAH